MQVMKINKNRYLNFFYFQIFCLTAVFVFSNIEIKCQPFGKIFNRYYNAKEYKGSIQNWAIAEAPNGLLYFGNHTGVLEYDGTHWRTIPVTNKSTIRSLSVLPSGVIAVGAISELGLVIPDEKAQLQYISLKSFIDSANHNFKDVWSIQNNSSGCYFLTDSYIFCFNQKGLKIFYKEKEYFFLLYKVQDKIFTQQVGKGLQYFDGDSLLLLPEGEFFKEKRIYNILPYKNKLLICTRLDGLFVYDLSAKSNRITPWDIENPAVATINNFFKENILYHAIAANDTTMIMGTLKAGAVVCNFNGKVTEVLNKNTIDLQSPVYVMHLSRSGILWLGLENGIQHVELKSPFRYWDRTLGMLSSIIDISVLKNKLYLATGNGLFALDLSNQTTQPNAEWVTTAHLNSGQVWSLLPLYPTDVKHQKVQSSLPYKNRIWDKTLNDSALLIGSGLALYVLHQNQLTAISNLRNIFNLYRSTVYPQYIYLGTDNGLHRIIFAHNTFYYDRKIGDFIDHVSGIAEDSLKRLWFVSNFKGIYRLSYQHPFLNPDITAQTNEPIEFFDTKNGLPALSGIQIFSHKNKLKFYIHDSIFSFDEKNKQFYYDTTYHHQCLDSNWKGAMIFNPRKNVWYNWYNKYLHTPDSGFCNDSVTFRRLQDYLIANINQENQHRFWIGSTEALFLYNNQYAKPTTYHAIIRSVQLYNDSIIYYGSSKIRQNRLASDSNFFPYKISFYKNAITFTYSALFFEDELKNEYAYYLKGYDDAWSAWSNETRMGFTNLREGKYTFFVKARNLYGIESSIAQYSFEILPPWYRTLWALLVYIILFVLIIIVTVKWYNRRLLREKDKLEKLVKLRTQEILSQHEEILVQAESLKEANEYIMAKNRELESQKDEITKRTEQLRKANLELLKLSKVASETDNAIIIFDSKGNMQWVNDGFTRMYGYTFDQFVTLHGLNIFETSQNENIIEAIKICMSEKKSIVYENKTKTCEGKEIWVYTTLTPVVNKKGETINLIAIDSDITRLKIAEAEIYEQKREIEEQRDQLALSNATQNKFYRIMAHDLRNPISTFSSSTASILQVFDSLGKEKTRKFIEELNKLSQNTFNLLENLLDWSSSKTGQMSFNPCKLDIATIINENLELIAPKIQSKKITVMVNNPAEIELFADENMIKTIIRNLLSNAIKFTPEQGKIQINVFQNEEHIFISIQDNGIGINQNDLHKLFRIDVHHTTLGTSSEKGSGLGLLLCKEFAEKNNGSISVNSIPGVGSTFTLTFKKTNNERNID